jgi:hypothetical protein
MPIPVFLASVPCVHLASTMTIPALSTRVAFGSSKSGLSNSAPIGLPVFIFASKGPHALYRNGVYTWTGTLGAIVPAVEKGARSGKHPDKNVRPPTAERHDSAFTHFWEVLNLTRLESPRPFSDFFGCAPFEGKAPEWPVLCQLRD